MEKQYKKHYGCKSTKSNTTGDCDYGRTSNHLTRSGQHAINSAILHSDSKYRSSTIFPSLMSIKLYLHFVFPKPTIYILCSNTKLCSSLTFFFMLKSHNSKNIAMHVEWIETYEQQWIWKPPSDITVLKWKKKNKPLQLLPYTNMEDYNKMKNAHNDDVNLIWTS